MRKMFVPRLIATATLSFSLLFGALPVGATTLSQPTCRQQTVTVHLSPSDSTPYHVVGWLCANGPLRGKTVQLLVHGLTYDHTYWDFPLQPQKYSYVRSATGAGYATFAIDRLGSGLSDHPADPNSLTATSEAYIAHQIVQDLRAGSIGGNVFGKVIIVGHSYGSTVTLNEAATYLDVSGVILSGSLHDVNFVGAGQIGNTLYPAQLDPKFVNAGLPDGYFTTMPGTRGASFYNTVDADGAVIAQDEALKQTVTTGELATVADQPPASASQQIHVPVFLAVGQNDLLFCDGTAPSCADSATVIARESQYYSSAAHLQAYVLPSAGHSINLHLNAQKWFERANAWADKFVGSGS